MNVDEMFNHILTIWSAEITRMAGRGHAVKLTVAGGTWCAQCNDNICNGDTPLLAMTALRDHMRTELVTSLDDIQTRLGINNVITISERIVP